MNQTIESDITKLTNILESKLPVSKVTIRHINKRDSHIVCIVFDEDGREATAQEFGIIKEFAMDNGYLMDEDKDIRPDKTEIFFYLLTPDEPPF